MYESYLENFVFAVANNISEKIFGASINASNNVQSEIHFEQDGEIISDDKYNTTENESKIETSEEHNEIALSNDRNVFPLLYLLLCFLNDNHFRRRS